LERPAKSGAASKFPRWETTGIAWRACCSDEPMMPTLPANPNIEKFFEHHLQTVSARLERYADEALKRQRIAWREALHRQAVLDEEEVENFRDER
jgi:hypothetical protein